MADQQPVQIPQPPIPSKDPTDLTKMEMAELSAEKRSIILYERALDQIRDHNNYLVGQIDKLQKNNGEYISREGRYEKISFDNGTLRRSHIEMGVSFALATVGMGVGGALISSYPIAANTTPWEFVFGWALLISGIVFGFTSRVLVWIYAKIKTSFGSDG